MTEFQWKKLADTVIAGSATTTRPSPLGGGESHQACGQDFQHH
jgi:hypothetical protein